MSVLLYGTRAIQFLKLFLTSEASNYVQVQFKLRFGFLKLSVVGQMIDMLSNTDIVHIPQVRASTVNS